MTQVPATLDLAPALVVLPGPRAAVADATGAQPLRTPDARDLFGRHELTLDEFHRRLNDGGRIVTRTVSGSNPSGAIGAIALFVVERKGGLRWPTGHAAMTTEPGDTVIELVTTT